MNEVRKYNNVTKNIPFLFLFLFLTLSGCGNQSINSNKETNVPEIYTEFSETYNGEVKAMDGFEGKMYYSYGLWGENSEYMHDTTVYLEIISCVLLCLSRIIWENSLILL